jgi:hypothetical protein
MKKLRAQAMWRARNSGRRRAAMASRSSQAGLRLSRFEQSDQLIGSLGELPLCSMESVTWAHR